MTTVTQQMTVTSDEQPVNGVGHGGQEVSMFSPYEHLFALALPHSALVLCHNCMSKMKEEAIGKNGPPPDVIKQPITGQCFSQRWKINNKKLFSQYGFRKNGAGRVEV